MSDVARHAPLVTPFLSLVPILIAAASSKARRQLLDRLRQAGATDAAHAIRMDSLKRLERNSLQRLQKLDLIKSVGDRYYYDATVADARCQSQNRRIPLLLAVIAAGIGLAIAIVLIGQHH